MRDPAVGARIGKAMVWNEHRNTRLALIAAGLHPGIEPNDNGFYPVSFHSTMNSAYAIQNRVRTAYPTLETHVKRAHDEEWTAVIYAKRA